MENRIEKDTMGEVRVPADRYWGAQTQRSKQNFRIGEQRMPIEIIHAFAILKKAAAWTNHDCGVLPEDKADVISRVCDEILAGKLDDHFPLVVWQTGSGTQSNMNVNEVISNRAIEMLGGELGSKTPIHPNDDVNKSQSSNDTFPTAMHIAAYKMVSDNTLPRLRSLHQTFAEKAKAFMPIVKIGRTHLMDATPLRLGQEFSGYARQIELSIKRISATEERLLELAIGGTAVGTGMNTHHEFGPRVIGLIREHTGLPFKEAVNHFEAQAARDAAVETSGALKTIAVSLVKIANDIRWLASGPRCGLGEIDIPSLQPGSSIMPGKVNPVIPEVVIQVAAQIMGNDTTITMGGHSGNFELNVMLPVIAYNLLQSIHLLSTAIEVFAKKCLGNTLANREKCLSYLDKSLALATALVPHIGYDRAAAIAKKAHETGKTIREIATMEGGLTKEVLDQVFGAIEKDV